MILTLESTLSRAIFLVVAVAITILFSFLAFIHSPDLNQSAIVIYLIVMEVLVVATFLVYRNSTTPKITAVKRLKNPRLEENSFTLAQLLLKEYDYIRETAAQIKSDRHAIVNYFLIISGVFLFIIGRQFFMHSDDFSSLLTNAKTATSMMVIISIAISVIGWIYFMQLIRLRQGWCDSAAAMNQIKDFYIANGRIPDDLARSAFLWDNKVTPKPGKKSNVSYYSTMLISFISAIFFLFASWILSPAAKASSISAFSWLIALYHFVFQMTCYSLFLDYKARH